MNNHTSPDMCIEPECEAMRAELHKAYVQIRRLLNRVNGVTAPFRHHNMELKDFMEGSLGELCDRQIEIEAWLKEVGK